MSESSPINDGRNDDLDSEMNIDGGQEGEAQAELQDWQQLFDTAMNYNFENTEALDLIAQKYHPEMSETDAMALLNEYGAEVGKRPVQPGDMCAACVSTLVEAAFALYCGLEGVAHEKLEDVLMETGNLAAIPYRVITEEIENNPEALQLANDNNQTIADAKGLYGEVDYFLQNRM